MVLPLLGLLAGTAALGQGVVVPWMKERQRQRDSGIREGLLAGVDPEDEQGQAAALMRGGLLDPNDYFNQRRGYDALTQDQGQFDATMAYNREGRLIDEERRQLDLSMQSQSALGEIPTAFMAPSQDPSLISYGLDALMEMESGGNYGAKGPVTSSGDRAYGAFQVMGANIPSWTKAALGREMTPDEFLADPAAQEAVARHRFGGYVNEGGLANAFSKWHSGVDLETAARQGRADVNMKTVDYTTRLLGLTQEQAQRNVAAQDPINIEARTRGAPWAALDPSKRVEILRGEDAIGAIEDTIDYLGNTTAADRVADPGLTAQLETQYQLAVLPTLQRLFAAGAMQEGELELFQKLAGNGFSMTQLSGREQAKIKGVLAVVEAQLAREKQALGLNVGRPERNAPPPGFVEE